VLHILARCVDALGRLLGILVSRILNTQVSAALCILAGANRRAVSCLSLPMLHKLVTPSDYSLPGGSSPIVSALARRCWRSIVVVLFPHTMLAGLEVLNPV
jgi:hypothetical protein